MLEERCSFGFFCVILVGGKNVNNFLLKVRIYMYILRMFCYLNIYV